MPKKNKKDKTDKKDTLENGKSVCRMMESMNYGSLSIGNIVRYSFVLLLGIWFSLKYVLITLIALNFIRFVVYMIIYLVNFNKLRKH